MVFCPFESVTLRPQNTSQAQNSKTPNPNRKLMIQNSKDESVWDKSSDSRPLHLLRIYSCIKLKSWQSSHSFILAICPIFTYVGRLYRQFFCNFSVLEPEDTDHGRGACHNACCPFGGVHKQTKLSSLPRTSHLMSGPYKNR